MNTVPKPKISILYSLARTGGTLVSRCLGCIPGNVVLSEVHPRGAFFHPLDQAKDWYGLFTESEWHDLRYSNPVSYLEAIKLIGARCREQGRHLIIRDWTHIDFTPVGGNKYPIGPIYRLSQYEALKEDFEVKNISLVRDPIESYLSVSRLLDLRGLVNMQEYFAGFHRYALSALETGYVRFEDFCDEPDEVVRSMCEQLDINFDRRFQEWVAHYKNMTGDVYESKRGHTHTGDDISERSPDSIGRVPKRPEYDALVARLRTNKDYKEIVRLLGYDS